MPKFSYLPFFVLIFCLGIVTQALATVPGDEDEENFQSIGAPPCEEELTGETETVSQPASNPHQGTLSGETHVTEVDTVPFYNVYESNHQDAGYDDEGNVINGSDHEEISEEEENPAY